jgi:hypothetical protein
LSEVLPSKARGLFIFRAGQRARVVPQGEDSSSGEEEEEEEETSPHASDIEGDGDGADKLDARVDAPLLELDDAEGENEVDVPHMASGLVRT